MDGTQPLTMGDRGRLVIPSELRNRRGWAEGTALIAVDSPIGLLLTSRLELELIVKSQLEGADLVKSLLQERRRNSLAEDEG